MIENHYANAIRNRDSIVLYMNSHGFEATHGAMEGVKPAEVFNDYVLGIAESELKKALLAERNGNTKFVWQRNYELD